MKTMLTYMFLGVLANTSAYAQVPHVHCSQFRYNDDGTWSPAAPMKITGPKGSLYIIPALEFRPGATLMGTDLGTALDAKCGPPGEDR